MKLSSTSLAVAVAVFGLTQAVSSAAVVTLDDFEAGEGHFNLAPNFSGTSAGFVAASSTADHDTTQFFDGLASQRIFIDDNGAAAAGDGSPWRVRHLSGGGTPANNISFASIGFVGFALRTSTPDLVASILIDDGAALERGSYLNIIADGQWHIYEWDLDNAAHWEGFAGTSPNGAIDAATVTIDALFFRGVQSPSTLDVDAEFFLDYVSFNSEGSIVPVPEPTSLGLVLLGGVSFIAMRRRR